MCQIEYFEEQPSSLREAAEDEKESIMVQHRWIGTASDSVRDSVIDATEDVMVERGIELEHDIAVRVPEFIYKVSVFQGKCVNVAAMLPANKGSFDGDKHVLVMDAWMFERMSESDRRDAIAHELAHAYAEETYGESDEHDSGFEQALDDCNAPFGTDDFDIDLESVIEDHPAHDHEG